MESLVLRYNPDWTGGGFVGRTYRFPEWARGRFETAAVESYDVALHFSREAWLGRIMSCRGVGASLSDARAAEFKREYRAILQQYDEPLELLHRIQMEVYRSVLVAEPRRRSLSSVGASGR